MSREQYHYQPQWIIECNLMLNNHQAQSASVHRSLDILHIPCLNAPCCPCCDSIILSWTQRIVLREKWIWCRFRLSSCASFSAAATDIRCSFENSICVRFILMSFRHLLCSSIKHSTTRRRTTLTNILGKFVILSNIGGGCHSVARSL